MRQLKTKFLWHHNKIKDVKESLTSYKYVVEMRGFEPLTSYMRSKRSPN